MYDPESPEQEPVKPLNRVFPEPDRPVPRPRNPMLDRPDFSDVGRQIAVMRSYQTTYARIRAQLKCGEAPDAVCSRYREFAELISSSDPESADAMREAIEDALADRPPTR